MFEEHAANKVLRVLEEARLCASPQGPIPKPYTLFDARESLGMHDARPSAMSDETYVWCVRKKIEPCVHKAE